MGDGVIPGGAAPTGTTGSCAPATGTCRVAPIVSPLIELDDRTGYLDSFTYATGKQARSPESSGT